MAKKKTWFGLIKRFFISESQPRLEKVKDNNNNNKNLILLKY